MVYLKAADLNNGLEWNGLTFYFKIEVMKTPKDAKVAKKFNLSKKKNVTEWRIEKIWMLKDNSGMISSYWKNWRID